MESGKDNSNRGRVRRPKRGGLSRKSHPDVPSDAQTTFSTDWGVPSHLPVRVEHILHDLAVSKAIFTGRAVRVNFKTGEIK